MPALPLFDNPPIVAFLGEEKIFGSPGFRVAAGSIVLQQHDLDLMAVHWGDCHLMNPDADR